MRALEKLKEVANTISKAKIPFPEKEAELIITHVTKFDRVKLYSYNPQIGQAEEKEINTLLLRRLKREPLQYILGECQFLDLTIKVGEGVLIPRPETEILVEEFLKNEDVKRAKNASVLDLCTGSGAIALAIAKNLPFFKVFGVDISERAIKYARVNKKINKIDNVFFLVSDLFSALKGTFNFITANPPYVKTSELELLEPEVREYEPINALNGGEDGLDYYRAILKEAPKYLSQGGLIFFEIGFGQREEIANRAHASGFRVLKIQNDLAGIERVMILKKS